MRLLKNIYLHLTTILLLTCSSTILADSYREASLADNDSLKYSKQIKTSLLILRLIQTNQRDSIINFYMNDHWTKTFKKFPELYNSSIDNAISLINEFGLPNVNQMTIFKNVSGETHDDFPDKYGVSVRFRMSPNNFRKKYGLIEFYFTEDQSDKVSIIFSSNPKLGRK
jgi:hypothetical protein